MKKVYPLLLLLMMVLLACQAKTITVHYDLSEDITSIESVVVSEGEDIPLPDLEEEWFSFHGWYSDSDYQNKIESMVAGKEDITLYGLFEPALSIAVIGDPQEGVFDAVDHIARQYALDNDRVYQAYPVSYAQITPPKTVTLDTMTQAIADGSNIIFLTSTFYQSEAVYEAQTMYPDIKFVLLGYEPKDHYYFGETYIASNTISTGDAQGIDGFIAGYVAVMEGYDDLAYIGVEGTQSITSGVGFIAGAYYAANILNTELTFNQESYKLIDHPSRLISDYFASNMYESGVELIYTNQFDHTVFTDVAEYYDQSLILGINSSNTHSESVIANIEYDLESTIHVILNDYFSNEFDGGKKLSTLCSISFDDTQLNIFTYEDQNNLLSDISLGIIDIPSDYASLIEFLENLESAEDFNIEQYVIEELFPY